MSHRAGGGSSSSLGESRTLPGPSSTRRRLGAKWPCWGSSTARPSDRDLLYNSGEGEGHSGVACGTIVTQCHETHQPAQQWFA